MLVKVICAWCGELIKEKEVEGAIHDVTHGICPKCAKKFEKEIDKIRQTRISS